MENVGEKICGEKKREKFAQKDCRICLREVKNRKWKPNRTRKMFVVILRDIQTQNAEVLTAVSRNCEFCCEFTFTFRKNFYL